MGAAAHAGQFWFAGSGKSPDTSVLRGHAYIDVQFDLEMDWTNERYKVSNGTENINHEKGDGMGTYWKDHDRSQTTFSTNDMWIDMNFYYETLQIFIPKLIEEEIGKELVNTFYFPQGGAEVGWGLYENTTGTHKPNFASLIFNSKNNSLTSPSDDLVIEELN